MWGREEEWGGRGGGCEGRGDEEERSGGIGGVWEGEDGRYRGDWGGWVGGGGVVGRGWSRRECGVARVKKKAGKAGEGEG